MSGQLTVDDCWFYHVMDLPGVGTIDHFGSWDLRGRFDEYTGRVPLAGKTFVDVGTASGFLSFEAEKRGATVTSFDVPSGDVVNIDPAQNVTAKRSEISKLHNSYLLAHHLLKSKARMVYGDALTLSQHVEPHDVVLVAQMLVHVRDPIAVLEQATKVARETIIVTEGMFESKEPIARFYGATYPGLNAWWHLSTTLYRQVFSLYGFEVTSISSSTYQCNHPASAGMQAVGTIVAERRQAKAE
jgi:hypothetical protein